MSRIKTQGFTLIEMMITVAILGIVLAIAAPLFTQIIQQQRLKNAAELFANNLRYANSESIRRNKRVYINVKTTSGNNWCYGIQTLASKIDLPPTTKCDCLTNSCDLKNSIQRDFGKTTLAITNGFDAILFDPLIGIPLTKTATELTTNEITFSNTNNNSLKVSLGRLGKISICSSAGSTSGYAAC